MQKIGIIGGGIRGHMYAKSLQHFPGADVRAVSDLSQATAEKTADAFGLAAYTDHRHMLQEADLDAVIVATPDFAHRDPAVDAAERGLHLLIEKPLATTAEDAAAIEAAVRKAGVECMVGFENRWNPAVRRIREVAAAGELGQVLTQNILLSNTWYVPTEMLSWAARSSPAWFLMSHTVDVATWVNGRTVTSVDARGSRGQLAARGVDTWDVVHALLTFDDGTTANLTSTWVLPDSMPSIVDFRLQAVGDRSAVHVDLHEQSVRHAAPTASASPACSGTRSTEGCRGRPRGWCSTSSPA
ncbi:Gfo/Idh/MocA family oxidoreductase [Streptomyces tubbatahanensis]|uniref:Gfo/Idh/MocA family oxidoreductase n=1 Tax=Streptomyces tubbatahanensis TaxID=2923272 RepID=A0ABY3XLC4_9ACTN|nr:Gfo/Idh/MocA family oxidoreductase [Streptomyces tubbatahanensis]UNS95204.1 Gfo/Idh/MocA family oxidoreductase [Streptomyces tubbatahanensis]